MLAAIRPENLNLPLFVHVFGAMVLVGGLLVTSTSVFVARGEARVLRIGYLSLLAICLPAYLVMRAGAEWIYAREELDALPDDPTWIGIGYITADAGALLLLIALVLGGVGLHKQRTGGGAGLLKASLVISVVMLAAYVVAIWAMGAKPG